MRPIVADNEADKFLVDKTKIGYLLKMTKEKRCVYLGSDGCRIHKDRPQVCRDFDCINVAERVSISAAHFSRIIAQGFKRKEN